MREAPAATLFLVDCEAALSCRRLQDDTLRALRELTVSAVGRMAACFLNVALLDFKKMDVLPEYKYAAKSCAKLPY